MDPFGRSPEPGASAGDERTHSLGSPPEPTSHGRDFGQVAGAWQRWMSKPPTARETVTPPEQGDTVVEHIPWERLTLDTSQPGRWIPYAAGLLVVAMAAGVIWFFRSPSTEPSVLTLAPAEITAPGATLPAAPVTPGSETALSDGGTTPTESTTLAGAEMLVSEADLLAFTPVPGERAALARAEWFVLDYFSTTDPERNQKLADSAVSGLVIPEAPPEAAYVDWVRALSAVPAGEGEFAVVVLYRSLTVDGGSYRAGPVRAVELPVAVRDDGASVVLDLPAPAPLPATLEAGARWPDAATDVPDEIAADALEAVDGLIAQPQVVGGSSGPAGWRVVVDGADASGSVWGYAVFVDPEPSG